MEMYTYNIAALFFSRIIALTLTIYFVSLLHRRKCSVEFQDEPNETKVEDGAAGQLEKSTYCVAAWDRLLRSLSQSENMAEAREPASQSLGSQAHLQSA